MIYKLVDLNKIMKIKNFVIGFAIFLLTLFVGIYGINTFYGKGPDYMDFCPTFIENESACVGAGGTWAPYQTSAEIVNSPKPIGGYCQYDYTNCQKEFDAADEKYWRDVFFIALPLGIIVIGVGALVFGLESVGAGLMFGGVGIMVYGVGGFWRFAQDWLKFSLSLIGLLILIWLGYRLNKKFTGREKELFGKL